MRMPKSRTETAWRKYRPAITREWLLTNNPTWSWLWEFLILPRLAFSGISRRIFSLSLALLFLWYLNESARFNFDWLFRLSNACMIMKG